MLATLGLAKHEGDGYTAWGDYELFVFEDPAPTRRLHIAFVAPSREQVDEFWRVGTDAGYESDGEPGPRPQYGGDYYGSFLLDPDGNSVELQVDNYGDWAQSSDFTRNDPAFAANPIGVNFDPDQLVAARDAGATHETIHQRAYRGDFEPEAPLDLRVGP